LARSRQELEAAHVLADQGFTAQAVSRAYYGAFYAAEQVLLARGESRSKQSGLLAAFGRLLVKQGGFPEETARVLRSLFEQRNAADYGGADVSSAQAKRALEDAERFVAAAEGWL
jgi:uncharacterized protein (UPF0332 family)